MTDYGYATTSTWVTTSNAPIISDGWRTTTYHDINGIRGWSTDTTPIYNNVVFDGCFDLFDIDRDIDRKHKDKDITEEELLELLGGEE